MPKFTPGPWKVSEFHGRTEQISQVADSDVCIAVSPHWRSEHQEELRGNFKLLAAAPDAYDLAVEIAKALEFADGNVRVNLCAEDAFRLREAARTIIEKAEK